MFQSSSQFSSYSQLQNEYVLELVVGVQLVTNITSRVSARVTVRKSQVVCLSCDFKAFSAERPHNTPSVKGYKPTTDELQETGKDQTLLFHHHLCVLLQDIKIIVFLVILLLLLIIISIIIIIITVLQKLLEQNDPESIGLYCRGRGGGGISQTADVVSLLTDVSSMLGPERRWEMRTDASMKTWS